MAIMHALFGLMLVLALSTPAAAQHPSVQAGKWLRVDFRARIQGDIRASEVLTADTDKDDGVDIARRRVGIEGRLARVIDYQVEYEIGAREWRDVYIDYRQFKTLQVRAGTFKLPFGLDETTSATSLDFIYRAGISSRLAPGRNRGVAAHGKLLSDRVGYEAGAFRHDGDNARPSSSMRVFGGPTVAARVIAQPLRGSKTLGSTLQVGAAIAGSRVPLGFSGVRARTAFGLSFFDSDVWVQGRRLRTGIEARWRPGRVSLQAEYIRLTDQRKGQSVEDGDLSPLLAHGWYVAATYAVTAKRNRVGRLEAAARIETLSFGSTATTGTPSTSVRADRVLGNANRVITLGANWHLNRWVKIQANLIREQLENPSMGPDPARPVFWSRVLRLQLAI